MNQPLKNLLVVSLEQAVAAPYCSSRLADAGARVIKIERPEGDFARFYDTAAKGSSSYFVWLNRGKQSLTADIKDPDDAALLHRILGRADVFIQNLAPGAAARSGFGSAELRARAWRRRNPGLPASPVTRPDRAASACRPATSPAAWQHTPLSWRPSSPAAFPAWATH